MTGAGTSRYSLGCRRRDLLAAALLALLVLAGSPFLVVYHRVALIDVHLVRIEPDGQRTSMPVPPPLGNRAPGNWVTHRAPARAVRALEARIRRLIHDDPGFVAAPPGTRFEWTIRYSENSLHLDRRVVYSYPVPAHVTP